MVAPWSSDCVSLPNYTVFSKHPLSQASLKLLLAAGCIGRKRQQAAAVQSAAHVRPTESLECGSLLPLWGQIALLSD